MLIEYSISPCNLKARFAWPGVGFVFLFVSVLPSFCEERKERLQSDKAVERVDSHKTVRKSDRLEL